MRLYLQVENFMEAFEKQCDWVMVRATIKLCMSILEQPNDIN